MDGRMRRLAGRTVWAASLFFGVLVGSFFLFNVAPGDPARIILGPNASEEAVNQLRHELGTDRPLWEQWNAHIKQISRLDLGTSIIDGRSVRSEVLQKFLITARVGLLGALIALGVSYVINLFVYYAKTEYLISLVSIGIVTPTFFTGVMAALLFGVWLPIVPLTGYGTADASWTALLLPASIASLYPIALTTRLLREKILAAAAADYTRAAWSLGFSKWQIFNRTLLRSVAVTWLAALVNQLSIIFVASFILEVIFSIPGVGSLLISTIQRKDYPMLQGILVINALFFITLAWVSDAVFNWLDPRVRLDVAS
jgi:peptide/nickel transport system permease protein